MPSLRATTSAFARHSVRHSGRYGRADGPCLLGVRRRVAAPAGTVTGPVGGPTVIEVELPCVW